MERGSLQSFEWKNNYCKYETHLDNEDGGKVDGEEDGDGGDEVTDGEEVESDGEDAGEDLEQEREVDEERVGHLANNGPNEGMSLRYFFVKLIYNLLMIDLAMSHKNLAC